MFKVQEGSLHRSGVDCPAGNVGFRIAPGDLRTCGSKGGTICRSSNNPPPSSELAEALRISLVTSVDPSHQDRTHQLSSFVCSCRQLLRSSWVLVYTIKSE